MSRAWVCPVITTVLCVALQAQTADGPRFEAADVKVSPLSSNPRSNFAQGPFAGGGRFDIRHASMLDLVRMGWSVTPDKIVGGPNWVGLDRFDIVAKVPANTSAADMRLMLQNLLAERFSLKVHKDTKPMPAFALIVAPGKKPHMKEADGTGDTGCKGQSSASGEGTGRLMMSNADGVVTTLSILPGGLVQYNCRNVTMEGLAAALKTFPGADLGPNPVTDETDLKGAWDFDLKFSLGGGMVMMGQPGERVTLADALEKGLGLKLDKRQVPVPVTVIDSANQIPTRSPAGVTLNVPPLPTEYEVADIKPTAPDFRGGMLNLTPRNGRLNVKGAPLGFLITQAWNVYNRDAVINLPKSADDRYDVTAKLPALGQETDAPAGPADTTRFQPIDPDTVNLMLRNLLIDRFAIKSHFEERPTTAFVLTSVKAKLKKADPANRTGFHEGPGADGKDPRNGNTAAGRLVTCENMTMKQFAQNLPMIAGGYIQGATVSDETGLEGAYDFTLYFSPVGMAMNFGGPGRGGAGAGGPVAEAADPSGAITLFEAMEKQLGLKLQQTKRPGQVLVIDHMSDKPTEN